MRNRICHLLILLFLVAASYACQQSKAQVGNPSQSGMMVVKLGSGDTSGFEKIRAAFSTNNPGYNLDYLSNVRSIDRNDSYRVAFVQQGWPDIKLTSGMTSEVTVGDIVMMAPGEGLEADSLMSVLLFESPHAFPSEIPSVIRPDWDPNITDIPGGCATETNAYRRILLTWKQEVGQYLYHAVNAHRVRIMDSFSHYHPAEGGFDEFYLVQMALPDARIITSNRVAQITDPMTVTADMAAELLESTSLEVGDLVYLPRGVMHRGIGGVLAQVITVPGFIPGSEIGVDHHLKAINQNLNLSDKQALPYHSDAANGPVIK
jgi:hypothetical protein